MKNFVKRFGFFTMLPVATLLFYSFDYQPIAFYVIFSATVGLSIFLERWIPYRKTWGDYSNDLLEDMLYGIVTIVIPPFVKVFAIYAVVYFSNWLMPIQSALSAQHLFIQLLLALLISGFLPYWYHRWSHTKSQFLWRIHSIHHSPEKLYWLNGFRFHPINAILNAFLSLFPLLLLGIKPEIVILAGFINNYVSILNHTNIDFRLGIFNYVFNMNEIHRWHHSAELEEGNNNYSAGALVIWDIVFSTYYHPKKQIGDIGLFSQSKLNFPYRSIIKQLYYPVFGEKNRDK